MTSLSAILLPTLAAAVLVFLVSSILHMVLTYHRSDMVGVPNEDAVMEGLRRHNIPPGDYFIPHGPGPSAMKDPAFQAKWKQGPVVVMTVLPPGEISMGKNLVQWFIYTAVIAFFAGYVASRTLPPGADYMAVFRVVGTVAFIGFAGGLWQNSIWYNRKWSTTIKSTVDSLIYGLLVAGVFGWLWP